MKIEIPNPLQAKYLTQLTLRSKAYWNYKPEDLKSWETDLTTTQAHINTGNFYTLKVEDTIVGFYYFEILNKQDILLDKLFVDPDFIGNNYGSLLLKDVINRVKTKGYKTITLYADPNAEQFYKKHGFITIDKKESSIKNRFLPIMKLEL